MHVTICKSAVLSAALANGIIIILMSRSLQVIVSYNTQRKKKSKQLIEDVLPWTCACSYQFFMRTQ